ncbi:MAG: damage-inducible protein CinA [Micavibrio sp.]|nr:damage-inducible protein CinA [Micavibrio sp.]|tara:strand:+ start:346144 stop:346614 length:471 start_codon:yes stop_codon:yes gene_type:complete
MALTQTLFDKLIAQGVILTTAESCTGGLIASQITSFAGSSAIFDRGFVTYSNQSKIAMLDVDAQTIENFGAVSEQTAMEMAEGALKNSMATLSVSVTGIAGPDGGTADKPIGTVCIGLGRAGLTTKTHRFLFEGDREAVRTQTVAKAFELIEKVLP